MTQPAHLPPLPGSYDCLCIEGYHEAEPERVCVPDRSAGQSSLAIYLAVGEYFYCMSVFAPSDSPHMARSRAIIS